jgi:clan AA aspartic protease
MMRGNVTPDGREAVIPVEVFSSSGSGSLRVEAVVDTGFTGHLTLPPTMVQTLTLSIVGSAESVLGDGSIVVENVCIARVLWHGEERPVRVLVADVTPLLGMALLRGSEIRVVVEAGGEVSIEKLPV